MHMADSLCCAIETNSTVRPLYSNKDLSKKKVGWESRHLKPGTLREVVALSVSGSCCEDLSETGKFHLKYL